MSPSYNSEHKRSVLLFDKLMYAVQQALNPKERSGSESSSGSHVVGRHLNPLVDVATAGIRGAKVSSCSSKYRVPYIVLHTYVV